MQRRVSCVYKPMRRYVSYVCGYSDAPTGTGDTRTRAPTRR